MPEKIRYSRETLLGFRDLPATKKLPKDLDVDVLRALTEASFFDTGAVGVTGQPRPPLRSRLIHDEATSSSGNGTIPRVVTPMKDRWDAGKKSVQYGGGKGGVTSPSGHHGARGGGTSRWVKMEEEESWRRKSDDGDMPAPRYAWNDAHIIAQRAHDDDDKTPEWATLNPNQKIQITADAIEAERQKMQAAWRKEKKKEESGEVEEVQNDEIEMWKREQEEHDRAEAEAAYQGRGHEQQQHVSASTSAPKGQPVNLAQLFGATGSAPPPGQGMNATQTGSTSDQQALLLAAQMRQARLNGEPPASSGSSQQQAKNLLAMLHQHQQQQRPQQSQQPPPPGYQQQQQQQQQGRGMPMMMGMPPPPQSPGAAGGMPMRPPMAQYSMPMPPPPGHPGMPPPPHMMPPPPNMMMMRPPPPGFSPGMMPQQQQHQAPGVRPGQPVNIAALFGSNTATSADSQAAEQMFGSHESQGLPTASDDDMSRLPTNTLDEPITETIRRDLIRIYKNLVMVVFPIEDRSQQSAALRNWDLWGPMMFTLGLAIPLSIGAAKPSSTFSLVFGLLSIGALVLTVNVVLLGGTIGFFQSLCLLGYCLFPLNVAAILFLFVRNPIVRWIVMPLAVMWASWASVPFVGGAVPENRRALAIYPLGLLYTVIGWLAIIK